MAGDFIEDFLGYLNLIHHLATNENAVKTQKIIQNVVNYLSYKFNRKTEIVMLKEEISQLDNLLGIFRIRFGPGLKMVNTIPEEYNSLYLPAFTIVAFVENALFHGLIHKEGEWKLSLSIEEKEEEFIFQIIDNGVGFDAGMKKSKNTDSDNSIINTGSIPDIITRLEHHFDRDVKVEIFSSPGQGTRVNISILKNKLI